MFKVDSEQMDSERGCQGLRVYPRGIETHPRAPFVGRTKAQDVGALQRPMTVLQGEV